MLSEGVLIVVRKMRLIKNTNGISILYWGFEGNEWILYIFYIRVIDEILGDRAEDPFAEF
jgi:hypothetical protein